MTTWIGRFTGLALLLGSWAAGQEFSPAPIALKEPAAVQGVPVPPVQSAARSRPPVHARTLQWQCWDHARGETRGERCLSEAAWWRRADALCRGHCVVLPDYGRRCGAAILWFNDECTETGRR